MQRFRFAAFISYSSKDKSFARKLHKELERYRIPKSLGVIDLLGNGARPNRIYPVFRDRDELPAGHLNSLVVNALGASATLIVICSPHSRKSRWVNQEIEEFVRQGRRAHIFAIIPDTVARGVDPRDTIPDALLQAFGEPIAADARKHGDSYRPAVLKVIAGLGGLDLGDLTQRDKKQKFWQGLRNGAALLWVLGPVSSFLGAALLLFWLMFGGEINNFFLKPAMEEWENSVGETWRQQWANADEATQAELWQRCLTYARPRVEELTQREVQRAMASNLDAATLRTYERYLRQRGTFSNRVQLYIETHANYRTPVEEFDEIRTRAVEVACDQRNLSEPDWAE